MEEALTAYLLAQVEVTALIGRRLRPETGKQGEGFPAVIQRNISWVPEYTLSGPIDLCETRIQFDCYAETVAGSRAVSRAIKRALSGRRFSYGGVDFQLLKVVRDKPGVDDSREVRLHVRSVDFEVWHSQP